MNTIILPQLLPQQWYQQQEVYWQPPQQQQPAAAAAASAVPDVPGRVHESAGLPLLPTPQQQQQLQHLQQPSRALLRLLWQWLAPRADAADLSDWPVLSVTRGKLRQLQQPAQVRLAEATTCGWLPASDTLECHGVQHV